MKLKDLKIGDKFLFAHDTVLTDGTVLNDVYVKKSELNKEWCIVGLPGVNDVFAAPLDTEVLSE